MSKPLARENQNFGGRSGGREGSRNGLKFWKTSYTVTALIDLP